MHCLTRSFLALLLTIAPVVNNTPANADAGGVWQDLTPMSLARQETGAARLGERIYVAERVNDFETLGCCN